MAKKRTIRKALCIKLPEGRFDVEYLELKKFRLYRYWYDKVSMDQRQWIVWYHIEDERIKRGEHGSCKYAPNLWPSASVKDFKKFFLKMPS